MAEQRIHELTLSNGLKLIGEVNERAHSASVGFFVKTGSRDETAEESGVSHFLEHMMFKGTKKRSALDLTFQMGNIGAQSNAYTSEEMTVYYAAVLPDYFSEMHEILCDMLRPSLDPEEFETEKKVILEEIALYQDRPQFFLFERAMSEYFGGHPAGNSVLGSTQSIGALSRDEMAAYFDRRYSPNNMTLVASGRFDWPAFVESSERYTSEWKAFDAPRSATRHTERSGFSELRKPNINQAHALLVAGGCSAQDPERFPLAVLATILGDSSGSKLYWSLIDSGLAEAAMADSDEKDGTGCFLAYATMEPEKIDEVSGILKGVLDRPLDFDEGELERAKTKLLSRIVLSGELPMGRLMSLGTEWVYRQEINRLETLVQRVTSVTRREIELAVEKFPLRTRYEFRLLPEGR